MKENLYRVARTALSMTRNNEPFEWDAQGRRLSATIIVAHESWDYKDTSIPDVEVDGVGKNLFGRASAYSMLFCIDKIPTALLTWPQFEIRWDHGGTFDPEPTQQEIVVMDHECWKWLSDNEVHIFPVR